ncbi:MAG: DUF2764 family protein [Candidatus Aureabacteria bacterium]|nr:DUF2764 family protein [Candidatus Auribacterota bacterium]
MSRNYYYLCASLPMLSFGAKPPMSNEQFLDYSAQHLSEKDFFVLKKSSLVPSGAQDASRNALKIWRDFEISLRNELVNIRAKKLGKDSHDYFRGEYVPDPFIAAMVTEAAGEETPLEVEKRIDTARWDKLEEIERQHFFDLHFLVVYFLKIQILNKWDNIKAEEGRKIAIELLQPRKELKE